jgi:hypothetical protein
MNLLRAKPVRAGRRIFASLLASRSAAHAYPTSKRAPARVVRRFRAQVAGETHFRSGKSSPPGVVLGKQEFDLTTISRIWIAQDAQRQQPLRARG